MSILASHPHVVSVTEASARGVSGLVRSAERGEDVVVERHGQAVVAVVSMRRLDQIQQLEKDLRESVLLLARIATDTGARTELDEVIANFGFDRTELEAELDAELALERE